MTDFLRRRWNAINPRRCSGVTLKGTRCRNNGQFKCGDGTWRCLWHREYT